MPPAPFTSAIRLFSTLELLYYDAIVARYVLEQGHYCAT